MRKLVLPLLQVVITIVITFLITLTLFGCGKSSNEFLGDNYYDGLDALAAMDDLIDEKTTSHDAHDIMSNCYDKIDKTIKDSDNESSISYVDSKKLKEQLCCCEIAATDVGVGKIDGSISKPMNEFTKERNTFASILGKSSRKMPY